MLPSLPLAPLAWNLQEGGNSVCLKYHHIFRARCSSWPSVYGHALWVCSTSPISHINGHLKSVYVFESSYSYLEFLSHQSPYSCKVAFIILYCDPYRVFSGGSVVKNLPINALDVGDSGSIPGLGRSPGEGNINPFQCFCLGNSMDRGTWQVTAHGVTRVGHNLAIIVLLLAHFQLFATPWTAALQASLSFTISWSFFRFMSIESVIPSNHLTLCCPLLLLPSILPSIRVFSNE